LVASPQCLALVVVVVILGVGILPWLLIAWLVLIPAVVVGAPSVSVVITVAAAAILIRLPVCSAVFSLCTM
jgi:hypothetical protein